MKYTVGRKEGRREGRHKHHNTTYIAFVLHDPLRQTASTAISDIGRAGRYGITSTCDGRGGRPASITAVANGFHTVNLRFRR